MKLPFLIGAYKGRSGAINVSECQNFFAELDQFGGQDQMTYIGTPGLKKWCDTGTGQSIRGMHVGIDKLYVVSDHKFYEVDTDGNSTFVSDLNTNIGTVHIKDNTSQICIIDGTDGYIYTPSSGVFKQITDTAFDGAKTLTYQDGYFIVNKPSTRQFQISSLYDGLSWSGLDYATKEGYPDDVAAVESVKRYLMLFGEKTSEVWVNTGAGSFPFERIDGASMDVGCSAPHSPAVLDNTVYWLSDERQIVRATGSSHQVISTEQIDYQIAQYSVVNDAIGYAFTFEGHPWYRLTFPAANETWCYDVRTNLWHKLTSWDETKPNQQGRHRGASYAKYDGKHLIGDYANGIIYKTLSTYYTDYDRPIVAQGVGRIIHSERRSLAFNKFEIEFEPGVGQEYDYLVDESGRYLMGADGTYMSGSSQTSPEPYATLDWSDDGGHTWETGRIIALHPQGKRDRVTPIYQLGSSRNRAFRVRISDPVKRVIVAAYADVTASRD